MNIIHIKYAIEVARVGSINKASENLGMAQPNISRAIKDLEADIGITIFDRSAKGMNLTPEGKEFIAAAGKILNQLNDLELVYSGGMLNMQKFSLSAPRAGYIAEAFARFSLSIGNDSAEIVFDETGSDNTIKKVTSADCRLGIIRYDEAADTYFKELLEKSELESEPIVSFKYMALMSKDSGLSESDTVSKEDLSEMIQITHSDPYEATISTSETLNTTFHENCTNRCIYILDSAAQLELLSENPDTFMWISPAPERLLNRYGLVQKECRDGHLHKDVLIYRKGYKMTELDKAFIAELKNEV